MANLAVFASGNGSNFQAIAARIGDGPHRIACLVCDNAAAPVLTRAQSLGMTSHLVSYAGRARADAEREILAVVQDDGVDLIALAGFMRLLSPWFIDSFGGPIVNVHPSLLPRHKGIGAIENSYRCGDNDLGITIHKVDYGLDSGPILLQKAFRRTGRESLAEVERRIHALEHEWYPRVIRQLLDDFPLRRRGGSE